MGLSCHIQAASKKAPSEKRQVQVGWLTDLGLVVKHVDGEDKSSVPASRLPASRVLRSGQPPGPSHLRPGSPSIWSGEPSGTSTRTVAVSFTRAHWHEGRGSTMAMRAGPAQNISLYMNKPLPPLPMTDHEHPEPLTERYGRLWFWFSRRHVSFLSVA